MLSLTEVQENVIKIIKRQIEKICTLRNDMLSLEINRKERRDIVTSADFLIEQQIVSDLKKFYPSHFFSSEETGNSIIKSNLTDVYEWIIDPIDGTVNFAEGLDFFSISVALRHNGITELGVIYCFYSKELFTVIRGKGSFCNGKRISVSCKNSLSDSVLSFMLTSSYSLEETKEVLSIVEKLAMKSRGLRLLVSQAMELCLIAKGCLEGTFCLISHGYSCAAGLLLITEAGGKVSDMADNNYTSMATKFVATNGSIHNEVMDIILSK